jgi:hypothetical protein
MFDTGRWLGRHYENPKGFYIFRVGNLVALAAIPVALFLYFYRLGKGRYYRLTNRRVVEMRFRSETQSIALDGFDTIEVQHQPGYAWYHAGDLVFTKGGSEQFRLAAVPRPEAFRQTCLKSHMSFVGIKQARDRAAVVA